MYYQNGQYIQTQYCYGVSMEIVMDIECHEKLERQKNHSFNQAVREQIT